MRADISTFIGGFTSQDPHSDLNDDGLFDLDDIMVFIDLFASGCP